MKKFLKVLDRVAAVAAAPCVLATVVVGRLVADGLAVVSVIEPKNDGLELASDLAHALGDVLIHTMAAGLKHGAIGVNFDREVVKECLEFSIRTMTAAVPVAFADHMGETTILELHKSIDENGTFSEQVFRDVARSGIEFGLKLRRGLPDIFGSN